MNARRFLYIVASVMLIVVVSTGCGSWRGANSLPLPGTAGKGDGAFVITAELPNVDHLQRNSRVRVGDVTVGSVTKIERSGWHAVITMTLDAEVNLPENSSVAIGQTSLLGSLHVELAPPVGTAPEGRLHNGSVIPLTSASAYPTTEQTLAAVSLLLNGGGIGQVQDITEALSTAFSNREGDLKSLLTQLDTFVGSLNSQTSEIIGATESLNNLASQIAAQDPVLERAVKVIPNADEVLAQQRDNLTEALAQLGKFSSLADEAVGQTKDNIIRELNDLGPVLQSLADAGPALTRSLSFYSTFPFPKETIQNWMRGDYANETAIFDLTLSRFDAAYFTGTRFEGNLTELEMQWGRTIGQLPSPYTVKNPLVAPYHFDQGP